MKECCTSIACCICRRRRWRRVKELPTLGNIVILDGSSINRREIAHWIAMMHHHESPPSPQGNHIHDDKSTNNNAENVNDSDYKSVDNNNKTQNSTNFEKPLKIGGTLLYDNLLHSISNGEVKNISNVGFDKEAEIYDWARTEIMAQYQAQVDVLFLDPVGPEILLAEGLDSAIKAILERESEKTKKQRIGMMILIVDPSLLESIEDYYDFGVEHSQESLQPLKKFSLVINRIEDAMNQKSGRRKSLERDRSLNTTAKSSFFSDLPRNITNEVYAVGQGSLYAVLKYPLVLIILLFVAIEFFFYLLLVNLFVVPYEKLVRKNRSVFSRMKQCTARNSWYFVARELDTLENRPGGGLPISNPIHDFAARLRRGLQLLENEESRLNPVTSDSPMMMNSSLSRSSTPKLSQPEINRIDEVELVSVLREICLNQVYVRLVTESLYTLNHAGANSEVKAFSELVVECIKKVATCDPRVICPRSVRGKIETKFYRKRLLEELQQSFGHTALCLSGGAGNCYYHLGVVKALLDANLLPNHLTGASGGALVGAFVATRTNQELAESLHPEFLCKVFDPTSDGWSTIFSRLYKDGTIFDKDDWARKLRAKVCGDLTFYEAYKKTGRSFTITAFDGNSSTRSLNHITAPNVLIYTAVLASSAIPVLLPGIELLQKTRDGKIVPDHSLGVLWRDGSFEQELPFDSLRSNFNAHYSIVSQVNPHLVPFFFYTRGGAGEVVAHLQGRGWRGGFVFSFLERLIKLDMRKWMELIRDFELMPRFFDVSVSNLFLGNTYGDITVTPPLRLRDYYNIVSDPNTPFRMRMYMIPGCRMIWPKLPMIEDRMRIEKILQEANLSIDNEFIMDFD